MTLTNYWPCTNPTGTTLPDIVGGNTATISAGDSLTTREGPAFLQMVDVVDFDFTKHYDLASSIVLSDAADFSFGFWRIKHDEQYGHLFGRTSGNAAIYNTTDTVIRLVNDAGTQFSFTMPAIFALGAGDVPRWNFILFSYDATTGLLSCFANGVESLTGAISYTGTATLQAFGRDATYEFYGGIAHVKVWDSAEAANVIKHWCGDHPLEVSRSARFRGIPGYIGSRYVHSLTSNQYATNAAMLADCQAAATNPHLKMLVLDIEPGLVDGSYTPYQWWVDDGGSIETWVTYDEAEKNEICRFFADYIAERLYYLINTIVPAVPALAGIPIGVYLESNHWAFSSTALSAIENATTQGYATGLTAEGGRPDPPDLDEFPGILQQVDFLAVPAYRESTIDFEYYRYGYQDYSFDPFRRIWDGDILGFVNHRYFDAGDDFKVFVPEDEFLYTLRAMQSKGLQYLCLDDFSFNSEGGYAGHVDGYWNEESGIDAINRAVKDYRGETEYEAYRLSFSGGGSTDAESPVPVHEQRANTYGPVPMELDTYDDGLTNATYQYRTMSDGIWTVRCENLTGTDPTIGLEATYLMEVRQKYRLKIRWRNRDAYGVNYLRYYDGAAWHSIEVGAHRGWVTQTVEFKAQGAAFRLGITSQETGSYLLAEFDEVVLTAIPKTTVAILVNAV